MCVYKKHAFICFGRPPSWSGTSTMPTICCLPLLPGGRNASNCFHCWCCFQSSHLLKPGSKAFPGPSNSGYSPWTLLELTDRILTRAQFSLFVRSPYWNYYCSARVLELVSQICDVVLVRRTFSPGKLRGVGILEWGGNGEGMEMGKSVY